MTSSFATVDAGAWESVRSKFEFAARFIHEAIPPRALTRRVAVDACISVKMGAPLT